MRTKFSEKVLKIARQVVNRYLNGEGRLKDICSQMHTSIDSASFVLTSLGYHPTPGIKLHTLIAKKEAADEYIRELSNKPSITKLAKKYKLTTATLSNEIKRRGYQVENYQNSLKFNENVFDVIDSEEKAYWLGFLYADGNITTQVSNKCHYGINISLKGDDSGHLYKFLEFLQHKSPHVTISTITLNGKPFKRCKINISNKHMWQTLYNLGCAPKKSLTLQFPNKYIIADRTLIRHFVRGYWDGDGCISYMDKSHKKPCIGVVGTKWFINDLFQELFPDIHYYEPKNKFNNGITSQAMVSQRLAMKILHTLYDNCTVYLDRKFELFNYFCRVYEESQTILASENGENCDVNPVITEEIKESSVL